MSVRGGTGYLHNLKVSFQKIVNNFKGKNCSFTTKKPGRHHHTEVTKLTLVVMGQSNTVPPEMGTWRTHFYGTPAKNAAPGPNPVETPENPKSRDTLQNLAYSRKKCHGHEKQGTVPS